MNIETVNNRLQTKWKSIINRCYGYHRYPTPYQQYGIGVCDEWRGEHGFESFRDWALQHGYRSGLVIDRIDTTGDYCPENCRFISQKENNRNRRDTVFAIYHGERVKLCEFCEEFGIKYGVAYNRTKKGLPLDDLAPKFSKRKGCLSLKELREQAGLTQEQFARKVDVHQSTVSLWEARKSKPLKKLHKKLARTLGCTVDELLSTLEEGKRNSAKGEVN